MQFKSPGSQVRSKPKSSRNQFKSPRVTTRSNAPTLVAKTRSPALITLPARPQTVIEQPAMPARPQAIIEHPTLPPLRQVPIEPVRAVAQSSRVAFRVFAICLASMAVCVNVSNYGPLIPAMQSVLHIDHGQVGLFSTFFSLGIIMSCVPGGILADRFGSRPVLFVTLFITTAGSLLFPVFPNFIWMIACRTLVGLGAGAALVACGHACTQLGKYEPQGQGLRGGATQLGTGIGLVSMSFLQGLLGWRDALFACGILGVVALIALLWYPKDVRSAAKGRRPAEKPALALRTPAIWILGLANMGTFGLINAIMAWISVYFVNLYGLPLVFAGSLGSTALFGGIFFQLLGGLLLARLQKPVLLICIGTVMSFLSVVALALPLHIFPLAIVGLVLFAVGTTLPGSAIFSTASVVGKISGAGAGISQALVAILASLVAVTGTPLIGLVFERTGSFPTALVSVGLIFPAIAVTAALFLGFVLKPIQNKSFALNVL